MKDVEKESVKQLENDFKASDVKKLAGLSYRQLHNWDSKGTLPNKREGETGWRKFSPREIFVILVCSEIRERFGVPLESLRFVQSFMLQEKANHFLAAVELMKIGLTVYLVTDLKETFMMDSDLELENLLGLGFLRGDHPAGYIFLKVNPIVNRILSCYEPPIELKAHNELYKQIYALQKEGQPRDQQEDEVLRLIREKEYRRILIHVKGGKIIRADVDEEVDKADQLKLEKNILDVIKSKKYQTVTVQVQDGKVVHIGRKSTIKFDKVAGKT